MKKLLLILIFLGMILSCGVLPEEIRGSSWYGSLKIMKTGYEGWTEPQTLPVTIHLHAYGYVEVLGLPNFTPSLTGNWTQVGKVVQIGGNYAANSYLQDPAYVVLNLNREDDKMSLVSGEAHRYTAALDKNSVSYVSEYTFEAVEDALFTQGLYFRDLEETKWVGDLTFEKNELGYSYSKDGEELMARVEIMVYPQSNEGKMRLLVTALTPNWRDPSDSSKVLPVGYILYDPGKFKNWSVSQDSVTFTANLNGEITFKGVVNNFNDYNKLTEIFCKKEECVFKIDSLTNVEGNTSSQQLIIKEDIVLKRDKSYSTSLSKF